MSNYVESNRNVCDPFIEFVYIAERIRGDNSHFQQNLVNLIEI